MLKREAIRNGVVSAAIAFALILSQQICIAEVFLHDYIPHSHDSHDTHHEHDTHHKHDKGPCEDTCCKNQTPVLASTSNLNVTLKTYVPFYFEIYQVASSRTHYAEFEYPSQSSRDPPWSILPRRLLFSLSKTPNAPPVSAPLLV